MKNLILFVIFSLITSIGYSQSEKILLKSFPLLSNNVQFDLDFEKQTTTWDKSYIKVEFYVKSDVNQTILDRLSSMGRYDFESKLLNGIQVISAPKTKNEVKINDFIVKETFFIKIFIPETLGIVDNFNL